METPPDFLKNLANRVATSISSSESTQALRMLWTSGLLPKPSNGAPRSLLDDPDGIPVSAGRPGQVGIWESRNDNGKKYFLRSKEMSQEWRYWANIPCIEPKKARKRIVLIGESAARGHFYDPQFTPAFVLQKVLESYLGPDSAEVIDLARAGLQGHQVRQLAAESLLLEPDAVVIFAGNNFGTFYSQPADYPAIYSSLHAEGVYGLKQLIEKRLAHKIAELVGAVATLFQSHGIPLVWIIPEFNLADWRDPFVNAPHLPGDGNHQWIAAFQQASSALKAGNYESAAEWSRRMIELDSKVNPAGLYILAKCFQQSGEMENARGCLEEARDAGIWDPCVQKTPRAYSVTQKTLREEAAKHGNTVVDLPRIFNEYRQGALPDRTLFLDYCHLTSEGIQITTAAAASCLLDILERHNVPWQQIAGRTITPSNRIKAEGAFLAAMHQSHWHQDYDLVYYSCVEALRFEPEIAEIMAAFAAFQLQVTPLLMCTAAEKIANSTWPSLQHYLVRYSNHMQRLDKQLLDAFESAARAVGRDFSREFANLRRSQRAVDTNPADLLDHYYCSSAEQPHETAWATPTLQMHKQSHYYRAYWLISRFYFVAEPSSAVRLALTLRLPFGSLKNHVVIEANGKSMATLLCDESWKTWDIWLPAESVSIGINEIVIRWPEPAFPGKKALEEAANNLIDRLLPEFYSTFGEIHSFVASAAIANLEVPVSSTYAAFQTTHL